MTFRQWAEPLCKKSGVSINVIAHYMGSILGEELKKTYPMLLSDEIIIDCLSQYLSKQTGGMPGNCLNCNAPAFGNDLTFWVGDVPYSWGAYVCSNGKCGLVKIGSPINPPS